MTALRRDVRLESVGAALALSASQVRAKFLAVARYQVHVDGHIKHIRHPAKQAKLIQLCPYRLVKSLKRLALVRLGQDVAKPLVAWRMTISWINCAVRFLSHASPRVKAACSMPTLKSLAAICRPFGDLGAPSQQHIFLVVHKDRLGAPPLICRRSTSGITRPEERVRIQRDSREPAVLGGTKTFNEENPNMSSAY